MTPIESARAWLAARTLTNNQANVLGTFTYCREVVAELIAAAVEQATPCRFGVYCYRHGFIHGAEAEELREKLEKVASRDTACGRTIQRILDKVDARDSLAFVEFRRQEREREEAEDPAEPTPHGCGR